MSEETRQNQAQPMAEAAEAMEEADPITTFFEAMATAIGVDMVFGEPVTVGDRTIIPVAETGTGGGVGFGRGPARDGQGPGRPVQIGLGGGGGGGANTRPVAAIIVEPSGVRVQPIVDVSRLGLAGIASAAGLWQGVIAFVKALRQRK